jgi:hypothetical protein
LLGRIACFRSPVKYEALKALAIKEGGGETASERQGESDSRAVSDAPGPPLRLSALDVDLRDLVAHGLLHHDTKEGRFDLHPIVRRYAYERLAASDRTAAHTRLRDYFSAIPEPDKITRLEDLAPVIELYHHSVSAGQFDAACDLFHARLDALFQFGMYQLIIDLLRPLSLREESHAPILKNESKQAWILNTLANSYSKSGQPRQAAQVWQTALPIAERLNETGNLATGLANVAGDQLKIGALLDAENNLRRSIALCRGIEDEYGEAYGCHELSGLLAHRGAYHDSEKEQAIALEIVKKTEALQAQGTIWAHRAQHRLLLLRSASQSAIYNSHSAIAPARRALELADKYALIARPVERDYVRAHWLLGAAYRVAEQFDPAEHHLHEALERCRRIDAVEAEADILIDLARLRAATGAPNEAQRFAEEALLITERSGYVLQGADAHLELAKLAISRDDRKLGKEHAQEAKALATCDGPPDYTYKAAYDEAEALLKKLGAD